MTATASHIPQIGGDFDLVGHDGHRITKATYQGQFVLLYFGFTNCRVVCPRALTHICAALALLDDIANKIKALYVSVDPERDTPAVMKAFLTARFPLFTGLTGERTHVDAMRKAFKVFAQRVDDPADPDGYAVPHTSFTYLLGPTGNYLAHFRDTLEPDDLAKRIRDAVFGGGAHS